VNIIRIAVVKASDGRIVAIPIDIINDSDEKAMVRAQTVAVFGRTVDIVWHGWAEVEEQ
jgi:hypothetical protein